MSITDADLKAVPEEEWTTLWALVLKENARRETLATAKAVSDRLAEEYLNARDGEQTRGPNGALSGLIADWVPPTGSHDAYTKGRIINHGGGVWESLVEGNVWEPGAPSTPEGLWSRIGNVGEALPLPSPHQDDPNAILDWVPEGHVYAVGDHVRHNGAEWVARLDHTSTPTWEPGKVPTVWASIA